MRTGHLVFAGAVVALAALTVPALANSSVAPKGDNGSASSTCSAYQQAPDGSWVQLPCKEDGERNAAPPQRHSAAPATTRTR